MKLVAIKNFANVKSLGLDVSDHKLSHELHIHKGLRFQVGKTEVFKDLREEEKTIVAQLIASKSAVADNTDNKDVIAKVDAEVKQEDRVEIARIESAKKLAIPAAGK